LLQRQRDSSHAQETTDPALPERRSGGRERRPRTDLRGVGELVGHLLEIQLPRQSDAVGAEQPAQTLECAGRANQSQQTLRDRRRRHTHLLGKRRGAQVQGAVRRHSEAGERGHGVLLLRQVHGAAGVLQYCAGPDRGRAGWVHDPRATGERRERACLRSQKCRQTVRQSSVLELRERS